MLEVEDLRVSYGAVAAVRGISLHVDAGEVVGLIGPNGAGKTSTLEAILGLTAAGGVATGTITLDGHALTRRATPARMRAGIALVPQGRELFGGLSVADNLRAGAWLRPRSAPRRDPLELLRDFPALHGKLRQQAATLSGGEQQMLALARGLAGDPTCVLLDEPSMGLSPIVIDQIANLISELVRERGLTVLVVDQGVGMVRRLATRGYVMVHGVIVDELDGAALGGGHALEQAYFG
jgi:branched-chain amino acid transport system ATP-binding protein